jgi:hypothetical protein
MLNKTETYTLLGNNVEYNNHRRQTDIQLETCLIYIDRLLAVLKKYKSYLGTLMEFQFLISKGNRF